MMWPLRPCSCYTRYRLTFQFADTAARILKAAEMSGKNGCAISPISNITWKWFIIIFTSSFKITRSCDCCWHCVSSGNIFRKNVANTYTRTGDIVVLVLPFRAISMYRPVCSHVFLQLRNISFLLLAGCFNDWINKSIDKKKKNHIYLFSFWFDTYVISTFL